MAELEQENLLEQYHLPEANTGINEQQARNLIQTPGMVDLLALTNLIETVTVIPTYTPTRFYDQFKIYVDSLTAPSIKVLYIYSNKTNAWIKVGVTDISGEKYIVQEASASLSAEQSLGALTTGLLKNTVTGSTGVLSTATANTDYAAATHATRHQSGGADAIKLDDLAAPDDNTDLNASTSAHGLAPKGTTGTTQFWRQDWTLAGVGGGQTYGITAATLAALDTERNTVEWSYVFAKKFTLAANFPTTTLRIYFELENVSGAGFTYGRIYKNGVAYGTERGRGSAGYGTFSENLSFGYGDTIELWFKSSDGSGNCHVQNFRILGQITTDDFTITNTTD